MSAPRTTPWIGGAAFGAVVILVGTWFLGVSPRLDEADSTHADAERVEGDNAVLQQEVNVLAAQFAKIEEYRSEVTALRKHVPTEIGAAEYHRQLDERATAAGVVLTGLTTAVPQLLVSPVDAQPAPAADAGTDDGSGGAEGGAQGDAATPAAEPTSDPTATASDLIDGFALVPVTVTVLGPFENVMRFVQGEQEAERIRLVHGLTLVRQDEREAAPGEPAVAVGDVEAVLSAYLYVLADESAMQEPGEPAQPIAPGSVPAPAEGVAPFVPKKS